MTKRTNVGRSNAERSRRSQPENIAYPDLNPELVGVSDVLKATTPQYLPGYPISPGYSDHPPISADNSAKTVSIGYMAHIDLQFVRESGSTNSISFPPFYYWEQETAPAPNIFM